MPISINDIYFTFIEYSNIKFVFSLLPVFTARKTPFNNIEFIVLAKMEKMVDTEVCS